MTVAPIGISKTVKTFASIFTGGAGADLGAKAAGLELIWGVELEPSIAEVAEHNLRHKVYRMNILDADPYRFERPDVLHASPPCPNFSPAKTDGQETELDIALAHKTAEFVRVLKPEVFTLENVPQYRSSKSWGLIARTLGECGYFWDAKVLNSADFGVPQTRRRMIVRALRGAMVPELPPALPWVGWYEAIEDLLPAMPPALPWVGWYEAIEDLLPAMPPAKLAPWQLERLPARYVSTLVSSGGSHFDAGEKRVAHFGPDEPAMTVLTGTVSRARAFLVDGAGAGRRAYVEPAFTITASGNRVNHRAWLERGRIVKMTPRALARFQSVPDTYELPKQNSLACRIVGNMVPPRMYMGVARSFL